MISKELFTYKKEFAGLNLMFLFYVKRRNRYERIYE